MKETMYLVTDIEFDVTHGGEAFDDLWTDEEYQNLKNDAIGLWYAQSENHLCDKITFSSSYYCWNMLPKQIVMETLDMPAKKVAQKTTSKAVLPL